MLLVVPTEVHNNEARVAATPKTVKQLIQQGFDVHVQQSAGLHACIPDAAYEAVGARLANDTASLYAQADVILTVRAPEARDLAYIEKGATIIGLFSPYTNPLLETYTNHGLSCFSLELVPRISRAQSMDVLSSQSNIAGYKSVLMAAAHYQSFFPMMMTAAGTVTAARVLVLGAGVAGLQAIATARRLGAIVEAFDVRTAAKEQVESLGAKFVEVAGEDANEDASGYAREMSDAYKQKQKELLAQHVAKANIIITTALIPGKPAPVLISESMVKSMQYGSVIVDMAAEAGGNCPLTEMDQVVVKHGVTLIGESNIPSQIATDASSLYAQNMYHFISLMSDGEGHLDANCEDEILSATLLCRDGTCLKPQFLNGGAS